MSETASYTHGGSISPHHPYPHHHYAAAAHNSTPYMNQVRYASQPSRIVTTPVAPPARKRPSIVAAITSTNKDLRKDSIGELSTPSSTENNSTTSNHPGSATTPASSIWADDAPLPIPAAANTATNGTNNAEGQLVSGPPGIARRAKAHVPSACVNCKKKHLACETKRPCGRCIQNGKEASCVDVQHKKRGRPRLREDDGFRETSRKEVHASNKQATAGSASSSTSSPTYPPNQHSRQRSKAYRELRSHPEIAQAEPRPKVPAPVFNNVTYPPSNMFSYSSAARPRQNQNNVQNQVPTVILTPDFNIAQHNRAFSDALSLPFTARGQSLQELVTPTERDKIRRLYSVIIVEHDNAVRAARARGEQHMLTTMPPVDQLDVSRATAGFQSRSEYWTFKLPREKSRGFPVSISLAREGGLFIVLTLVSTPSPLQAFTSPPANMAQQQSFIMGSSTMNGLHSPPAGYVGSPTSQPVRRRIGHNEWGMPSYTGGLASSGYEEELLAMQAPAAAAAVYRPASPQQSMQMPYNKNGSRTTSSSSNSNSLWGPEIPRSDGLRGVTSGSYPSPTFSRDGLGHLQLPPIRISPTNELHSPTELPYHRRRHTTQTPSPARGSARGSPHGSKRKKRRRLEIGDVLH